MSRSPEPVERAPGTLARLQQLITVSLLAGAAAWLLFFWSTSPLLAVSGGMLLVLGYSGFLAIEFFLLRFVNRPDPAPQPSWRQLAQAWLGETLVAPRVFCWRQPFRSQAFPDEPALRSAVPGRRGLVFIHGFFCNRGFWAPWLEKLQGSGHAYVAVNLEPVFSSIDDYVPLIDAAVRRVTQATGLPPLLVCHSMGGLAARAWLKAMKSESRVHHVVTLGTPHGGTWLARFSRVANGRQMQLAGAWHQLLDQDMPAHRHTLFTCWYSNCDNIVFPSSTATLPGADNRLVQGVAHVQLAFRPEVMQATLAMTGGDLWKSA
ncbi:MAG: alpha/beta fold hydrolase [Pseudomonadota bacterium]